MKHVTLGTTDLTVSQHILGLMRIPELSASEIRTLVGDAQAEGIDFFDHADIYGAAGSPDHVCESLFADALNYTSAEREKMVLQTKCGIRPGYFDFSAEHILDSVEGSLAALKTDYLDLLLLHRPDALVEPDEVAAAFEQLHSAGKVRHFGVSNHTPGQIELLKKSVQQPLVVNQIQLSITHAPSITSGLAMNMAYAEQSIDRHNGVLDYCRLNDITVQAWSPFQSGGTGGVFIGDRENFPELNDVLDELAGAYGVTPTAIAAAWITRHPARIQLVLGTTKGSRVREAAAGSEIELTRPEWYRLLVAGGGLVP
jgi:predicted oxidoreductase